MSFWELNSKLYYILDKHSTNWVTLKPFILFLFLSQGLILYIAQAGLEFYSVAQAGLKLAEILLLQPPEF